MKEGFVMFSNSLVSFCSVIFFMVAIFPAMMYGVFIAQRIIKQEPKSSWLRKLLITILLACVGGIIFPITIVIMVCNWEHIENDIDRALFKAIRFVKRFVRRITR